MVGKTKFYVVWKGRKSGVFSIWEACAAQVDGFHGAQYRSFSSRAAAEQALRGKYAAHVGKPISSGEWLFAPNPPVAESLVVDAACSGNPGWLEYRGVELSSGKEVFRQGPYENGTNNVGEFLAIVQALEILERQGNRLPRAGTIPYKNRDNIGTIMPVYTDSETALAWVKAKRCNTKLAADRTNAALFLQIDTAEDWLVEHKVSNPVLNGIPKPGVKFLPISTASKPQRQAEDHR